MKAQLSSDGTWHVTLRLNGRIYLGYGASRKEATDFCFEAVVDRIDTERVARNG
jgi:hypothetical protein